MSKNQNPLVDIKTLRRSSFKRPGEMFKGGFFESYFEPIKIIGVGAFGSVISARSKEDGSLCAIKVKKKKIFFEKRITIKISIKNKR
jgi:hypothetical protein